MADIYVGQKRVSDPWNHQQGYWEPHLDPLEEQQVLLIAEPSIQSLVFNLFILIIS